MAVLTVQTVVRSGVGPTYASCAGGGDKFLPDATTFLHVKNGSGGALTVTVAAVATVLPNLPVGQEAALIEGGHIERVPDTAPAEQDTAASKAAGKQKTTARPGDVATTTTPEGN